MGVEHMAENEEIKQRRQHRRGNGLEGDFPETQNFFKK
jgi:hypothetical protein